VVTSGGNREMGIAADLALVYDRKSVDVNRGSSKTYRGLKRLKRLFVPYW